MMIHGYLNYYVYCQFDLKNTCRKWCQNKATFIEVKRILIGRLLSGGKFCERSLCQLYVVI